MVPALVTDVRAAWLSPRQVLIMSFLPATVAAAARALPDHGVCLLLRARDFAKRGGWQRGVDVARNLGARRLNVEVHRGLDAAKIAAAHEAGLAVYVWTVNRVSTAHRLAVAGIDGITTDRCAWMRRQIEGAASTTGE